MLSVNMIAEVYGLFLGFMVVALWGAFEAANSGVSAEATTMSQLIRNAEASPPPAKADVVRAVGK